MSGRMVAAAARRLALGLFFGVLGGLGAGALAAGSASAAGPLVPEPTSTGFSDGDIDEIGLSTWDLAYDPVGDRLVVADCEVVLCCVKSQHEANATDSIGSIDTSVLFLSTGAKGSPTTVW